jgi:hypothetical protein
MKEHPTDTVCTLTFVGPVEREEAARDALHALGFEEAQETIPWRDAFPAWSEAQLPGVALAGARTKEGITQVQLARMTGIPQRHISEMEHGKRVIGKERAKKLAKVLKIDYHIFL